MTRRARVLVLMSTRTYRAAAFLRAVDALGLAVTVGSQEEQALAAFNPAGHLTLDFGRPREAAAEAVRFAKQHPLDAVTAAEDDGVVLAAEIAARLGLPHHAPDAVRTARDKHATRTALREAGLRTPAFARVPTTADPATVATEVAETIGVPCVVKPLSLAASRGVIRADDADALAAALRRVRAIVDGLATPADDPTGQALLVERYLPGREIALEGLVTDGQLRVLALFDKPDPLQGPYFEETIYVTPSRWSDGAQAAVAQAGQAAVEALGLRHGPVHIELRYNEAGPWVLEVAPRSIGGHCGEVLRFDGERSDGGHADRLRSLEALIVAHALGRDVSGWRREDRAAGVMMIPIPRAGVLCARHGRDEALAVPHVEDVRLTLRPGQRVVPVPEGSQYLGFIFARADTPAAAEDALRAAHGRLSFEIMEDEECS